MEFGLDRLVGRRSAFVNLTRPFVVGDLPVPFAPGRAVLELLETVPADPAVIAGAARLREQGYQLALDDWAREPEREALLAYADIVKLDISACSPADLEQRVRELRTSVDVTLVAERIETAQQMDLCQRLGFDWFQGYFLLRPDIVSTRSVSPAQVTCMRLLGRIADPEIDLAEIEHVVRGDLGLNYRILRAANAAAAGTIRRVESIRDALVLLGMQTLRSWLLLMVLSDGADSDSEHLVSAMTRARTCELVAERVGGIRPESAFLLGLLSSLDSLLGVSMSVVAERLPLAADLEDALLHRRGILGAILTTVLAVETMDEAGVAGALAALPLGVDELTHAYLTALTWAGDTADAALAQPSVA
jgi:EAL and modified HD-GYP domain-containing signal transduction protein